MSTSVTEAFTGTIEFLDLEGGVWVLTTDQGQHYALFRAPQELLIEGLGVTIQGSLKSDMMTAAQVGEVLEVQSFTTQTP
ncbi:MAG: hypothetical protein HC818_08220 [Synechococcaceae cyanobacterium RM1_1_27]|nr:hypothetical protein [Synechococcaceae cyanobacterium SM2_3_2]NJO86482.1 hypothetical protein [Synechococcaceae cyanobacterium RM1_1_27]